MLILVLIPYFATHYNLIMRPILSEKNLVVLLFILVLVTFSLAQEDSKKMEKMYSGVNARSASSLLTDYLKEPVNSQVENINPK